MIILDGIKNSGIYCILNKSTAKTYVGSAKSISTRCYTHGKQLSDGKHHSILLQRAYDKYGHDDFEFVILEFVANENELLTREQYWIDLLDCANPALGYNLTPTAGSLLGMKHTVKAKANMKTAMTEERKTHLSNLNSGKICGPRSEEIKSKIKATLTGRKRSDEVKNKISMTLKNKANQRRIAEFPIVIQVLN